MQSVYLLLIRSNTYLSKAIHLITGDEFTHISISFDRTFTNCYSFGRKWERLPLPAGLVQENFSWNQNRNYYDSPCSIYELRVSTTTFDCAKLFVEQFVKRREQYHYSFLGLICCAFSVNFRRKKHYFCSQFIGEILVHSKMVELPKPPGLMHPIDYAYLKESCHFYSGKLCELQQSLAV